MPPVECVDNVDSVCEPRPRRRLLKLRCGGGSGAPAALFFSQRQSSDTAFLVAARQAPQTTHPRPSTSPLIDRRSLETSLVVHTFAFAWFLRVWLWHCTPAAGFLPGAQGWGWFLRYLTFYNFTLQTFALGASAADDWSNLVRVRRWRAAAQAQARRGWWGVRAGMQLCGWS